VTISSWPEVVIVATCTSLSVGDWSILCRILRQFVDQVH
jgi:hypothetical protein